MNTHIQCVFPVCRNVMSCCLQKTASNSHSQMWPIHLGHLEMWAKRNLLFLMSPCLRYFIALTELANTVASIISTSYIVKTDWKISPNWDTELLKQLTCLQFIHRCLLISVYSPDFGLNVHASMSSWTKRHEVLNVKSSSKRSLPSIQCLSPVKVRHLHPFLYCSSYYHS
jgi:hypothetical protein